MTESSNMRSHREQELLRELSKLQVELREDSNLCKCFIEGTLGAEYNAEIVAKVTAIHKFLFCYTSFISDCKIMVPQMTQELATPLGSYEAASQFVKQFRIPLIKRSAILNAGGLPTDGIWPWMTTNYSSSSLSECNDVGSGSLENPVSSNSSPSINTGSS
jgi:hypothetical protein